MSASKSLTLIGVICLATFAVAKTSDAQELRRYQPSTPTVSPYLRLSRFNTGGLPNYYSLVRPLNRQRQVNLQTQRLQRQQALTIQQLSRETPSAQRVQPVQQLGPITGTGSRFRTSGDQRVYRDTLQFYPSVSRRR